MEIKLNIEKIINEMKKTGEEKIQKFPLERPSLFDSFQIRNPSELEKGKMYQRMRRVNGKISKREIFKIIGDSYLENFVLVELNNATKSQIDFSLADMGIIPYKDGTWNPTNYVIPIK